MPLFLDDEQVAPKVLAKKLGIKDEVYDRLIAKPMFRLDKSQEVKKKTIKSPEKPMFGIKSSVWIQDADGLTKRLTWAESRSPKIEAGVRTWVYQPPYINLKAGSHSFKNEPDKAFFMYLRPGNPQSPFAGSKKMFTFIDRVAETLQMTKDMSDIQKALSHATNVEEEELVILAKGLKLQLNDDYDITELRLRLQQYAINPATNRKYIMGMEDEIVRIDGRIANLIDKGMVKLEKRGSTARQWVWATGSKEGGEIGELIMNVNDDARQRLMTFMKANLNDYLYELRNSTVLLQADRKAREVLATEKVNNVPEHLLQVNTPTEVPPSFGTGLKTQISNYQEARDYLGEKGYGKASAYAKALLQAVQEDQVTEQNIDVFLLNLTAK